MKKSQDSLMLCMHLIVIALIPLQLFILMPAVIYLTNIDEMNVRLFAVLKVCLLPFLFSTLIFYMIYRLSSHRFKTYWLIFLATTTFLLWLQGNVILWDYGVLDGKVINWSEYQWRSWIDFSIWGAISVIAFFSLCSRLKILFGLGILTVVMQVIYVLVLSIEYFSGGLLQPSYNDPDSLTKIYEFSKKQNVIHIIVDGFQGDVFDFLINDAVLGDNYRRVFSGFTYYKENLGVFPYTEFALPALFSGQIYRNQSTKEVFLHQVFSGKNILNQAKDEGFELDIASVGGYVINRYAYTDYDHIYDIDQDISVNPLQQKSAELVDLALFRSAPHFLKPYIYNNQHWLVSTGFQGASLPLHYFKHTRFLYSLMHNIKINREQPVYKLFHVMNTHNPMVVNKDCQFKGSASSMERHTLTMQSKCTLDSLTDLLEKFQEVGIFDTSLIIIHADHGGWVGNYRQGPPIVFPNNMERQDFIKSLASPLLLIKKPHAVGELQVSKQLTSLLQLPNTIADVLSWEYDYGHASILDTSQPEKRSFYWYSWQQGEWSKQNTQDIMEFDIFGSHYDVEWRLKAVYSAQSGSQ